MEVELFGVDEGARMEAAFAVRFAVFVEEQQVPAEEEVDEHDRTDPQARHAVIRDGAAILAAGRYYPLDATAVKVGRMAVLAPHRGAGVGRRLLDALLGDARARGFTRAVLHAQDHAVGFYARAGFAPSGATFYECDILHQPMERAL